LFHLPFCATLGKELKYRKLFIQQLKKYSYAKDKSKYFQIRDLY